MKRCHLLRLQGAISEKRFPIEAFAKTDLEFWIIIQRCSYMRPIIYLKHTVALPTNSYQEYFVFCSTFNLNEA